jgi:hypothetical protein
VTRPLLGATALAKVDAAILCICLDEPAATDIEAVSRQMLHSDSRNRWYDKTVQLVITAEGVAGVVMEHASFDGHSLVRLLSEMTNKANIKTGMLRHTSLGFKLFRSASTI